jgi:hypothetical protein
MTLNLTISVRGPHSPASVSWHWFHDKQVTTLRLFKRFMASFRITR